MSTVSLVGIVLLIASLLLMWSGRFITARAKLAEEANVAPLAEEVHAALEAERDEALVGIPPDRLS